MTDANTSLVEAIEELVLKRLAAVPEDDRPKVIDAVANALINIALQAAGECPCCITTYLDRACKSATTYSHQARLAYLPPAGSA